MTEYVKDFDEYYNIKKLKNQIILENEKLPNFIFSENFHFFSVFDFDLIFENVFLINLLSFSEANQECDFYLYIIDPDPVKYFYKNFYKYGTATINVKDGLDGLNEFMMLDPGDSAADALFHNAQEFSIFANSQTWAIYCSRSWEMCICAFCDINTQGLFELNIDKDYIFKSMEDFFASKGSLGNVKHRIKNVITSFVANYPSK